MTGPAIPAGWPVPLRLLTSLMWVPEVGGGIQGGDAAADLAAGMNQQDWAQFAQLAIERHRVAPLIWGRLQTLDLPDEVRAGMQAALQRNARITLTQMSETTRLVTALEAAGAEPVILKSWPMAERLLGQPAARHTGDLDILVAPNRISVAAEAMADLGYKPSQTHLREARLCGRKVLAEEGKDISLRHPDLGITAELHWRLLNYRGWLETTDIPGAVITQQTQAGPLRVLSDQANMMFLPLHGGLHIWTRLKWLADLAPLTALRGPDGLAEDLDLARRLGVFRSLELGLRLSARLFGQQLPDGWDLGPPRLLERMVLRTITQPDMLPVISKRYRALTRMIAFGLASGVPQFGGVIRYDTLRRWRYQWADPGLNS